MLKTVSNVKICVKYKTWNRVAQYGRIFPKSAAELVIYLWRIVKLKNVQYNQPSQAIIWTISFLYHLYQLTQPHQVMATMKISGILIYIMFLLYYFQ